MTAKLLLGLLLTTTLTAAAAPDRPQPAEDPCGLARRIAQSPPCLAGSACEALDLWREAFGKPDVVPVGAGQLPPELASRLPDSEVTLEDGESFESALQRLGKASGFEVLLHPGLKGKIDGQLGPIPVEEAWKILLGRGGFLTHFDGERLRVAKAPSGRPRQLGRYWAPTFDCRVR